MAAAYARMLGSEKNFMIDHHAYRLEFARQTYSVSPINFDEVDPAELLPKIQRLERGYGYRCGRF
jgi:threonine dehydrogenase-like Zn-dependent dehydrogenase